MSTDTLIEISSNDPSALCMLFINGKIAEVGQGHAAIAVKGGQRVRWFVRPSRRNRRAGVKVVESRGDQSVVLFDGRCHPIIESGVHVPENKVARRSPKAETPARPPDRASSLYGHVAGDADLSARRISAAAMA